MFGTYRTHHKYKEQKEIGYDMHSIYTTLQKNTEACFQARRRKARKAQGYDEPEGELLPHLHTLGPAALRARLNGPAEYGFPPPTTLYFRDQEDLSAIERDNALRLAREDEEQRAEGLL